MQTSKLEPEVGGAYISADLLHETRRTNDLYETLSTTKLNNNNNNNDDETAIKDELRELKPLPSNLQTNTEVTVTSSPVDFRKQVDHATDCSPTNVTSSSSSDEMVVTPSKNALNDVINDEYDEYACDTPVSLSPSRDSLASVTSSDKQTGSTSVLMTSTTPRSGNGGVTSPAYLSGGSATVSARCPPVREAVDPAKYITLSGEADGVKYACSKCGNVYKWRKSLNKHWKEKHDGEAPDGQSPTSASVRLAVASSQHHRVPAPLGASQRHLSSPLDKHSATGNGRAVYASSASSLKTTPGIAPASSLTSSSSISGLSVTASGSFRQPTKGSLAALNPALFGKFSLHPKSGSKISSHHQHLNQHQNLLQSSSGDNGSSSAVHWSSNRPMHVDPLLRASASQNGSDSSPKPMDYFRLGYDTTAAGASTRDVFSTASSRFEAPVDLSETSKPYRQSSTAAESSDDMDVLDLSRKFSENGKDSRKSSLSAADDYLAVQDEPLDFSLKVTPTPSRTSPINFTTTAVPHPGSALFPGHILQHQLSQNKFPFTPLVMASSVDIGNRKSEVGLIRCGQCPLQFTSPTKLNRHCSREHADVVSISGDDRRQLPDTEYSSGSAQLYRYLTANATVPHPVVAHRGDRTGSGDSTSCLVCGRWFASRSAAARHFDDHHAGGLANPYRHQTPLTGNRSESDKITLNRTPNQLVQSPPVSATGACGTPDDLLMAHCTDEHTAIVIPQAPEDVSVPTMSASSISGLSKMFVPNALPPKVGNSTTGRSRRAELLGFSVSSSGTTSSGTVSGGTPSAEVLLPFKCQLCEYRARWPSEMTQHAKNHSDEKPFRCPQCSYRSKWKWDVVKHLKRCGGGNCTARDVIDMSASMGSASSGLTMTTNSDVSPLQQQQQQQKGGTFSTQRRRRFQTVRSVLINVQQQQLSIPPVSSERQNGSENNMGRTPSDRNELPEVLVNSTGSGVTVKAELGYDLSDVKNGVDQDKSPLSLPQSGSQPETTTKPEIKRETAAVVSDGPSSPSAADHDATMLGDQGLHYCVQCPFVGHSPAELRRHQRVHSDEKPYSCRSCSYSSKWKCDLKKHLRAYNHVSAVPLVYGGHGRKPALPADWGLGLVDARDLVGLVRDSDFYDQTHSFDAAVSTNGDGVSYERGQGQVKGKHPGEQAGSGLAAGITTGGRLRCRRCEFEAVDITSFLQHKALHHSNRYDDSSALRQPCPVNTQDFAATSVLHGSGGSRKRKSSKQNRVPQLPPPLGAENISAEMSDGAIEMRTVDEDKFWKSLGLKSSEGSTSLKSVAEVHRHEEQTLSASWNVGKSLLSDASASYVSSPAGSRQDDVMDCDNVSTLSESTSGLDEADYSVAAKETNSLKAPSDDKNVDEPVDLCSRSSARRDEDEDELSASGSMTQPCGADESRSSVTSLNGTGHVRRHWSWSKGIEGCTWRTSLNGSTDVSTSSTGRGSSAEAEELAAMSRRKRKLRTCDKCGYVTDNLTTLQRHSAKHGSTGRHRCSLCTYTVERQHILDYHIKIVHSAPQTPAAVSPSDHTARPASSENSFYDHSQTDDFEPDPDITFLTKRRLTNGDHETMNLTSDDQPSTAPSGVQTSRVEADDSLSVNHVSTPPPRAGLCVGRSCIQCGFVSRTDGSAARHRLIGHSGLHFRCGHVGCERRTSTPRIMETHRNRVHSGQDQVEPGKNSATGSHVTCSECPYRSASPSRVTSHARLHAQPHRKHRCPECSYSVDRRSLLGQHRRLHDRKQSSLTMTSTKVRCRDCPFWCRSAAQLALHQRHHLTGSRRFECSRCSFGVDVCNAFQHHRKLHASESS